MKNQRGFIELPVLIGIIAVIVVLAGGAYFIVHQNTVSQIPAPQVQTNIPENVQTTPQVSSGATAGWKTYTNIRYGFEFKYPVDYQIKQPVNFPPIYFIDTENQSQIGVSVTDSSFSIEDIRNKYAPTGLSDSDPEKKTFGENTFYYYGPGGGGVNYPDQYFYNLNGKLLSFGFDGPYENDKTPSAAAKQMESQILSTFKFTVPNTTTNTISVPGMTQYADSSFGFSFWHPSVWNVQQQDASSASNISGVVVVKQIVTRDDKGGVIIDEVSSSSAATGITDTSDCGPADGCPSSIRYYFNTPTHTWMLQKMFHYPGFSKPDVITPADVSINTMGGLHMLRGNARFGSDVIIPISARNFLVVKSADPGGTDEGFLAKTVLATDPAVATPLSTSEQIQTIQAEAKAYNGQ